MLKGALQRSACSSFGLKKRGPFLWVCYTISPSSYIVYITVIHLCTVYTTPCVFEDYVKHHEARIVTRRC